MALTVVKYRKGTNAAAGGETGYIIRNKVNANHQIITEVVIWPISMFYL